MISNSIKSLEIFGFKCFKNTSIEFRDLTILAGLNSVGKSSVIQSLLLTRIYAEKLPEQHDENFPDIKVPLNGRFGLALGNSKQVLRAAKTSQENHIDFYYKFNHGKHFFSLGTRDTEAYLDLKLSGYNTDFKPMKDSCISKKEFYYLNAERIGPRISYDMRSQNYDHAGWQGEFAIQMLGKLSLRKKVPVRRLFEKDQNATLRHQVNLWMSDIIPGLEITTTIIEDINKAAASYNGNSPFNVGFGISYVLPIVINGLIAEVGSMFIVENPEAHLHPSGQSKIGKFLAMIANSGVQVVIETHSEHVINGVRNYWLKEGVDPRDCIINFLDKDENNEVRVNPILIENSGELSHWPRGFFDQTQIDFGEMIEHKRKLRND